MGTGAFLRSASATAVLLVLLLPAAAQAHTITVGSSLWGPFPSTVTFGFPSAAVTNVVMGDSEAVVSSPVDGAVVRWRLVPQTATDAYDLRIMHPNGDGTYTWAGTSSAHTASTTATQTFATDLPILAGDLVALESLKQPNPNFRATFVGGLESEYWAPVSPDGSVSPVTSQLTSFEFGFNADVQPAPGVVLVSPASGQTAGGTAVTIAGSDFDDVSAVSFGSVPAASFSVESESEITATAPAAAAAGPVDVSVTTIAGRSPSVAGDVFTYAAPAPAPTPTPTPTPAVKCTVPSLIGKKLPRARRSLTRAHCKLGKVTGKRAKGAKVVKQSPKPLVKRRSGTRVSVKLG
jgi:hypothetical protein